jgi:hypothetical protein
MPVRRVRRIIRRVDPWTVLKVSLVFNAIAALAFVLGSVIFWSVFVNAGQPDKIIDFEENLGITFTIEGEKYFRVVVLLSVIWSILATGLLTLGAVLYNLIADTVGGIEVVVLEEVVGTTQAAGTARPVRSTRPRPTAAPPPQQRPPAPPTEAPTEETTIAR